MSAEYKVYIDWDGDGDYTGTGEDVTGRVLERGGLRIQYGRDQARALSPTAPGEAAFDLDNQSRDYSPDNTSSPLSGEVRPGRPVKIDASLSGTTYTLFHGQLDDFEIRPDIGARDVPVTCLDALGVLKGARISTAVHEGLRSGQAVGVILDAVGWPDDLRDLDMGATTFPWFWAEDDDAFDLLMQVVSSEGPTAYVTVDSDGRIAFHDRHHRLRHPASTSVQVTFRDTGTEPLMSSPMRYDHGWRDIVNSVRFPVTTRVPSGDRTIVWSETLKRTISEGQILGVQAKASGPFVDADIDYTLVSGVVETWLSRDSGESTTLYIQAFGGPATITDLAIGGHLLVEQGTVVVGADDPVSIWRYGKRSSSSLRAPVWAGVHDAKAIADLIVGQRAERLPIVTITVTGDDTRLAQQLTRNLSDRVRIVETQTGLNTEFFVERIEHEISEAGLRHVTRFGCEKVPGQIADLLVLGDSTRGKLGTGRLGRTGLDDESTVFVLGSTTQGLLGSNLLGY